MFHISLVRDNNLKIDCRDWFQLKLIWYLRSQDRCRCSAPTNYCPASLQHLEETKLSIMHNQLASLSWQGRIIHVIIIIEEKFTSSKNLSINKIFQLAADVEHGLLDLLIHHFIDMTIQ